MNAKTRPELPDKVYLRRGDVEKAVGGWRQLRMLETTGRLKGTPLPGYKQVHFVRAEVQAVLAELWGE